MDLRPLATLAFAALLAPSLGTSVPQGLVYTATDCNYVYSAVAHVGVPALSASSRLAVVGAPSAAAGFLITAACDVSVLGAPAERTLFSDAGAVILPPDGSPGLHLAWVWDVTTSKALRDLFAGYGVPATLAPAMTFRADLATPVTTVEATMPDDGGVGSFRGAFAGATHPGADGSVAWWSEGPAGLLRLDQAFVHDAERPGVGLVEGPPRGRMATFAGVAPLAVSNLNFADLQGIATVLPP